LGDLPVVKLHPRSRAAWLCAYVVATVLSFPHPIAGGVLDLGWLLAWWGPACLILGLGGLRGGRRIWLALLVGTIAHGAILHWIYVVTVVYGHAPVFVGFLAPPALALYMSFSTVLFALGWGWLEERGLASPFAAAALWVALDHSRSWFLTGFPWATLGYAQHLNVPLRGLSTLTGVYGLSFVTVLAGAVIADLVRTSAGGRRPGQASWIALAMVFLAHGAGWWLTPSDPSAQTPRVRVAALQGNIDQGVKWSRDWSDRTLGIYEELTRDAAGRGARLVVWPETAVPGALEFDPVLRERIGRLARETSAHLVVGGVGVTLEPGGRRFSEVYDSAFVFQSDGSISTRYDKAHLVPFGEYVPLRSLLGHVLGAVASGITSGDVSAGDRPRAVELESQEFGPGLKLGLPICYELLFPDLVRRFARDGAGVLFALTNDAWYGRTGAPYQFLAITALRSVETGLWTVRAANTGVSAVIDAGGQVVERTEIFERGLIVADVPVFSPESGGRTFYARHGDVFAWSCWLAVIGLGLLGRRSGWRAGDE